ncbi:hypothetical protein VNO80_22496 [Phaseolus coccineus]|uniref:Uncharacterized protein n=1 Tax=Phaseolus coccineus TaxID=3886 RepID=A0AAN9M9Y7_PHACN
MDVAGGSIRAAISQWELAVWRQYQHLLDKWRRSWDGVSYGLGIYILNRLIGFLSPQVDPEILDGEGPTLPSSVNDEFRPFVRRLPGFKFWFVFCSSFHVALTVRLGVETGAAALPRLVFCSSFHAALAVWPEVETGAAALLRLVFCSSFHAALIVWLGVETGGAALPMLGEGVTGVVALPRLGEGVVSGDHMQKFWQTLALHPFHEEYFLSGSYDGSIFHWLVGHVTPQIEISNAHDNNVWDFAWHPIGYLLCREEIGISIFNIERIGLEFLLLSALVFILKRKD